ncbi:hypothetical protein RJT34_18577 [Clitoria ternatea]|uniref:BAG domain-containing protein n=1 Tax=Clitoria ternatea TaxID=43366 RepID=A0AAN9JCL4_CLITE
MPGIPQPDKKPSKVVNVPVQFVGSEPIPVQFVGSEPDKTGSAIKIQKVLRGFLVRKIMRKIAAIRVELEQIENKAHGSDMVELMRREQKERLRVAETIMNLLLRLDSVRVLHFPGLRECRKSLINKAIALQEAVDQLGLVGPTHQVEDLKMETSRVIEGECVGEDRVGKSLGGEVEENCLVKEEGIQGEGGCEEYEESKKLEALRDEEMMEVEKDEESVGLWLDEEVGENCLVEEKEGECEDHGEDKKMRALSLRNENEEVMEVEENGEESVGTSLVEENCLVKEEGKGGRREELLVKMVEDNEKMMVMMEQLFKRNEMQTRLLNSLSQRVEQLERAFACEKLRKKRKNDRKIADAKRNKESAPKDRSSF